jgi:hypothetical protein
VGLDRRLRDELSRHAEHIVPDVERNLGAVEARTRRRNSVGGPTLLAAAIVVALAIALRFGSTAPQVGGPSESAAGSPGPASPGISPSPAYDAIAGTYVVTLDARDPAASAGRLGGSWTMRLLPDGEMLLSAPQTFAYGSIAPSGNAFSTSADRFRTNLFYNDFCNSIGTYTWLLQGGRLSFAPVDETCSIRQTLLATSPWQAAP